MKKVIIDISLDNKEALGMLKDYLDDNLFSYQIEEVGLEEGDLSLVASAFEVGDIVTITGNRPTRTTARHFLELGEVCKVVNFYNPINGGIEVSPLNEESFSQRVHPWDIKLV